MNLSVLNLIRIFGSFLIQIRTSYFLFYLPKKRIPKSNEIIVHTLCEFKSPISSKKQCSLCFDSKAYLYFNVDSTVYRYNYETRHSTVFVVASDYTVNRISYSPLLDCIFIIYCKYIHPFDHMIKIDTYDINGNQIDDFQSDVTYLPRKFYPECFLTKITLGKCQEHYISEDFGTIVLAHGPSIDFIDCKTKYEKTCSPILYFNTETKNLFYCFDCDRALYKYTNVYKEGNVLIQDIYTFCKHGNCTHASIPLIKDIGFVPSHITIDSQEKNFYAIDITGANILHTEFEHGKLNSHIYRDYLVNIDHCSVKTPIDLLVGDIIVDKSGRLVVYDKKRNCICAFILPGQSSIWLSTTIFKRDMSNLVGKQEKKGQICIRGTKFPVHKEIFLARTKMSVGNAGIFF